MKFSVRFQRSDKATWEYAPVLGESSDHAWRGFTTWRLFTATEYHAASVQPISTPLSNAVKHAHARSDKP